MRRGADPRTRRPSAQRLHEGAERVASRLEVAELVEARTRRREENDVAGETRLKLPPLPQCRVRSQRCSATPPPSNAAAISSAASPMRYARSSVGMLSASGAYDSCFPRPPRITCSRSSREGRERAERRRDVRRLGVVHVPHAADLPDELDAMRTPSKLEAPRRSPRRRSPPRAQRRSPRRRSRGCAARGCAARPEAHRRRRTRRASQPRERRRSRAERPRCPRRLSLEDPELELRVVLERRRAGRDGRARG